MLIKYPRTHHVPWSPGCTSDDKIQHELSSFVGKRVIVTKKMDGENTTMTPHCVHARSLDSVGGADRDFVKSIWAKISNDIPTGWRICGENLWAKHSIAYTNLPSFFLAFSVWDETNTCLSWDNTLDYLGMLELSHVPVIHDLVWDDKFMLSIHKLLDLSADEGYVIRLADSFHYNDFPKSVVKYVREGHVTTGSHWRTSVFVPNTLI